MEQIKIKNVKEKDLVDLISNIFDILENINERMINMELNINYLYRKCKSLEN
jgi:hypothetical protein